MTPNISGGDPGHDQIAAQPDDLAMSIAKPSSSQPSRSAPVKACLTGEAVAPRPGNMGISDATSWRLELAGGCGINADWRGRAIRPGRKSFVRRRRSLWPVGVHLRLLTSQPALDGACCSAKDTTDDIAREDLGEYVAGLGHHAVFGFTAI